MMLQICVSTVNIEDHKAADYLLATISHYYLAKVSYPCSCNNSHPHAHHHHRPAGQSWARRKQEQQAGRYPSLTAANDGAAEEQESSPSSPSTDQGAGVVVPVGHQTRTANGSATGLLLCLLIVLYIYLTVSFYCPFSNIIYWGFPIKTYFVVNNFILK